MEHVDERLRLFEGGVVGSVLDDVQRPAERSAGSLGDAQRRGHVVATPDQCRRHGDAGQDVRWDLGHPELGHQRPDGRQPRRLLEAVDGVVAVGRPALTETLAHAVEVVDAVLHQSILGLPRRVGEVALERFSERWRRFERRQPERVDEHERSDPIAVFHCVAHRDGAAEHTADDDRCDRTRRRDDVVEPGDHPLSAEVAIRRRLSMTWQIRGDDMVPAASASSTSDQPAANSPGRATGPCRVRIRLRAGRS